MNQSLAVTTRVFPDLVTGEWRYAAECLVCGAWAEVRDGYRYHCDGLEQHHCSLRRQAVIR